MEGFIDIHSHILPGIDDGAGDMEETREMLRIAYREGIRDIITTPHFFASRQNASPEAINEVLCRVQKRMEEWKVPIRLYTGNEIFYRSEIADLLEEGRIHTLAGSQYILVEFDPTVEYTYLRDGIIKLASYDYLPIVAHAERYECLFREKRRLRRLKEHGALLQVNGSTLSGSFMSEASKRGRYMVKQELIDFLGTDAHSSRTRSPRIQKSASYLYKKLGKEKAEKILFENPRAVIHNELIE
ncbi:MAG: CpsB/CapC family capsule biosynthesis tyrosine phosphatase [Kineothrix sp.]